MNKSSGMPPQGISTRRLVPSRSVALDHVLEPHCLPGIGAIAADFVGTQTSQRSRT